MPKELLHDQDLVCLLGALIVAKAEEQLRETITYLQAYSAKDIKLIWDYLSLHLSHSEKEWFRSLLIEA